MKRSFPIKDILLDGNHLCLNFVNTIHNRLVDKPDDYIINEKAWLEWLQKVGLLNESVSGYRVDLVEVKRLRELLYSIFYGIVHGIEVAKKDMKEFNRQVLKLRKATKITLENNVPTESINTDNQNLNSYLPVIVKAAYELLFFENIGRIKECGNCGWLFLDTSKGNQRKWCNMKTCGNEIKARRHYQKMKKNGNTD